MTAWDVRQGHVLDVLRSLPAESVQVVCCSPPYWGLRSYRTEPQIWGGDPDCPHSYEAIEQPAMTAGNGAASAKQVTNAGSQFGNAWREVVKPAANGIVNSAMQGETLNGTSGTRSPSVSALCARCGAWRGELGSEPTIELYVEHIVAVFREVRRVLRSDGVLFLNVGDSYAGSGKGPQGQSGVGAGNGAVAAGQVPSDGPPPPGLKAKDLCLIPFRLALALQADGWWVRSDIAWCKRAPMPESVTDRPTSAWEHVFLLSKSAKYFYDSDAVRELQAEPDRVQVHYGNGYTPGDGEMRAAGVRINAPTAESPGYNPLGRNQWNYWLLSPEPYAGAHFATYPTELVRRCVLAGSSERGCCPSCGAPWRRVVDQRVNGTRHVSPKDVNPARNDGPDKESSRLHNQYFDYSTETLGWAPSCACNAGEPVPCLVLDPFSGSGTTGVVALRHGRRYLGIELNESYVEMSRRRIESDCPMFNGVEA